MRALSRLIRRQAVEVPSVTFGGRSYPVHALTLGALHDLTKAGHMQAIRSTLKAEIQGQGLTSDQEARAVEGMLSVIAAALGREVAWVRDNVSAPDAWRVLGAIWKASGLVPAEGQSPNVEGRSQMTTGRG